MSAALNIEQLKADLAGFKGKTFPIYTEELTALIERVEAAEKFKADFDAWMADLPRKLAQA